MLRRQATAHNPLDPRDELRDARVPRVPRRRCRSRRRPVRSSCRTTRTATSSPSASYPTFDNRWFESDLGDGKFEEVFPTVIDPVTGKVDPDTSTLTNRAIQGRYNLGSTFKPFTAYAALNTGLLGVNDYYEDLGRYTMESVEEDKCNTGPRPLHLQERHLRRHAAAVRVRQRRRRDGAGGVERRVLLPHRRADHDAEQLRSRCCRSRCDCSASAPTPASSCRSSSTARCPTRR